MSKGKEVDVSTAIGTGGLLLVLHEEQPPSLLGSSGKYFWIVKVEPSKAGNLLEEVRILISKCIKGTYCQFLESRMT